MPVCLGDRATGIFGAVSFEALTPGRVALHFFLSDRNGIYHRSLAIELPRLHQINPAKRQTYLIHREVQTGVAHKRAVGQSWAYSTAQNTQLFDHHGATHV